MRHPTTVHMQLTDVDKLTPVFTDFQGKQHYLNMTSIIIDAANNSPAGARYMFDPAVKKPERPEPMDKWLMDYLNGDETL